MRIKGVPLEEAAPNVQQLYRKIAERLGRVTIPLTAFAHCPEIAEAYSALGAGLTRSQGVEPRLKMRARGADRGLPFLSGHQLCRWQRTGDHRRAARRTGDLREQRALQRNGKSHPALHRRDDAQSG